MSAPPVETPPSWFRRHWRWVAVFVVVIAFAGTGVMYLASNSIYAMVQCDGALPRWMLRDYNGSGCAVVRPSWEASLPWNLGPEMNDLICLGMCADVSPGQVVKPR